MEETLKTLQERTDIMARRAIESLVDYINAITAELNYYRDKCIKKEE